MRHSEQTQALVHASRENFPVASWLLPACSRTLIRNFYIFARSADNIADSHHLPSDAKLEQLQIYRQAVRGSAEAPLAATPHIADIRAEKISADHALRLLTAFEWDAENKHYRTWDELLNYCAHSANPVGRLVLEACRENSSRVDTAAADALCSALQLLNHLQDLRADYQQLQRIYLPWDWMKQEGATPDMLAKPKFSIEMHLVYLRLLDGCQALLEDARALPDSLKTTRLRMEVQVILAMAEELCAKLRKHDPLAKRVSLTRMERLSCALRGMWRGAFV